MEEPQRCIGGMIERLTLSSGNKLGMSPSFKYFAKVRSFRDAAGR